MDNKPLILRGNDMVEELYPKLPNMNGKELAIITIGDDEASKIYVRNKIKACERVGLKGVNYKFEINNEDLESDIKYLISDLNCNRNVVGIMIQQPYHSRLKGCHLEERIITDKDVDGLSIDNMYFTLNGEEPTHYPATPIGIIEMLDHYNIPLEGKNVVIIGRSDIVGKPLAAMMTARNATITLCHSKTKYLWDITSRADIIVSAVGKAKYLNKSYLISEDVMGYRTCNYPTIIDVGINRDENGKLCGDCDFDDLLPYVSAITPVPLGIGACTVYELIKNCCKNG